MSLLTLVRSRCMKGMNLDVPRTRNMGSVTVFTRGLLLTGFCLVTAVSNTVGGKQQDPLPEFPFSHTRRANKVVLNGSLFRKRVHLKS